MLEGLDAGALHNYNYKDKPAKSRTGTLTTVREKERRQRVLFTCGNIVSTDAYQATSEQKEKEPQIHVALGKRAKNSYLNLCATSP